MTEKENIQARSEFIKTVGDFARYINKEYIEGSNSEYGLLVIAGDETVEHGKTATTIAMMGGKQVIRTGMSALIHEPFGMELMESVRKDMDFTEDFQRELESLRQQRRWHIAGLAAAIGWSLFCVLFCVLGTVGLFQTIASILIMFFLGVSSIINIKATSRKIRHIRLQLKKEIRTASQRLVEESFKDLLKKFSEEDDDD